VDLATAALTDLGTIGNGTRVFEGFAVSSAAPAPTISADGKTAQWTDVDGDGVTLKITTGKLTSEAFRMLPGAHGSMLARLDLDSAAFQGTNVTITAKPGAAGGDGLVNIGAINAYGVDLGKVSIAATCRKSTRAILRNRRPQSVN